MYTASRDLFKASHLETTSNVGLDLRQFVIIHVFWCFFFLTHHHFLGRPDNEEVYYQLHSLEV